MSAVDRRSRSTTGVGQRPPSRDSTASLQSAAASRLVRADSITQFNPQAHAQAQYAAQHMTNPQPQHSFDHFTVLQNLPPQQHFAQHSMPMGTEQQFHPQIQNQNSMYHSHSMQNFNPQQTGVDHYALSASQQSTMPSAQHSRTDMEDNKKRNSTGGGAAAATQSNEKELRESLERNVHRTLKDVAKEVIDTERTSRAEKSKQLFAMLWLNSSCESAKTSVPRSRVYASYADRCATERVQPLNPASFGKLVRIIFKGIQTRRLGVRGESKYHYVDLALKSESQQGDNGFARSALTQEPPSPASVAIDFNNVPVLPANALSYALDGSPIPSPVLAPRRDLGPAEGAVFAEPYGPEYKNSLPYAQTYPQQLSFPVPEDEDVSDDVELPDLWPYAPEKADEDAADALRSLYRSHCTSLVEYFKKCKDKQFWRTFTTFQGTLTVPVQKLLTAPSMATWIRECDFYMYQKMFKLLARIALDVLPHNALIFFNTIALNLHAHIVKTFQGMPLHVLEARLEPATRFCELVNRTIKVNNAAHAASGVLEDDKGREQLHREWLDYINPKRLMEGELPGCGYEVTYKILTEEMSLLMRPLTPSPVYQDGLPYANADAQNQTTDNYIDRIDRLLRSLPHRFPQASPRMIVSCVKNLSTAAMREFTMQGAPSFHAWWIVKVFMDEYSQWLITSGGFMAHRPGRRAQSSPALSHGAGSIQQGVLDSSAEGSKSQSRLGSIAPVEGADDAMANGVTDATRVIRKRRSDEFDDSTTEKQQEAKRTRLTPDTNHAPHFEHQHPSFGTSFGTLGADGVGFDTGPDTVDMSGFDDSGIGLGLLGEEIRSAGPEKKKGSALDRAPLVQQFNEVESTAIAI